MLFKKTEEKQNFVKWIAIFLVSLLGYNITVCMILGFLKITSYIWMLSIINILFSALLGYKAIKNKDCQKYYVRKQDIAGVVVFLTIFIVILIKDINPFDGGLKYAAIDSAIHYRAAKHFSDNLMIFVNVPDKTLFNFNVMQTGAYINDGIFMNIVNGITGMEYQYIYEIFEISILFLSGFVFYAMISDRIKNKTGFFASMILLGLYIYGYPYNSYMYGFSYLSVSIAVVVGLILVVQMLYEKINFKLVITLIAMLAMGLIFSYCLYVPTIFAAICIYAFIKDFKSDEKAFLKIFKKRTLIVTGVLLAITVLGIGYLLVPTFFIADQSSLVDALTNGGGTYKGSVLNFRFYAPFGLLYLVYIFYGEIVKLQTIKKNKKEGETTVGYRKGEIEFLDIFAISTVMLFIMLFIGVRLDYVSDYYFSKVYNLLWIAVIAISTNLINMYSDRKKTGKIMLIYTLAFLILVVGTIILKASTLLDEGKKQALPNYIGIYFEENCDFKGLIKAYNNLAKEQIEVIRFTKTLDDITADNITLISGSYYERTWTTAMRELTSTKKEYQDIIQDTNEYTIQTGLDDPDTKYIVRVNESYDLDQFEDKSGFEILFQNSRGYVLKKK